MKTLARFASILACALIFAGCDKKDAPKPDGGGGPSTGGGTSGGGGSQPSADAKPYDGKDAGEIKVTVKIDPTPGEGEPIDVSSKEYCKNKNPNRLKNETILAKDGLLQNAYVVITKGLEKWTFTPPSSAFEVKQEGCHYIPHVYGVMKGQDVQFRNAESADETHNVKKEATKNPTFSFNQPKAGAVNSIKFDNEERMVRIQCDVHSWMNSWMSVERHPCFGVTDESGTATIKGVPPGDYTLEAMHESSKAGKASSQKVKVEAGKTAEVTFTFKK